MTGRRVVIGTRKSLLATWQAECVQGMLEAEHGAGVAVELKGILSYGDKDQTVSLSAFSEKGVFTKELDLALLGGEIDCAVHSMKDLPTTLPPGLCLAAVVRRGETRDAFVARDDLHQAGMTLEQLPSGSVVGTSSLRRRALLQRKFPHLVMKDIRGNIHTRLRKLDDQSNGFDAILLASVGLERVDLGHRITQYLDANTFPYAVCQGALAVVCREHDDAVLSLLQKLQHRETAMVCEAERGLLRTLEGGCKVPIAVHSILEPTEPGYHYTLVGTVLSQDGRTCLTHTETVDVSASDDTSLLQMMRSIGDETAHQLSEKGAVAILDAIRNTAEI